MCHFLCFHCTLLINCLSSNTDFSSFRDDRASVDLACPYQAAQLLKSAPELPVRNVDSYAWMATVNFPTNHRTYQLIIGEGSLLNIKYCS
ncbi:hypothetical protein BJ878DRAFT_528847 [Calycina marina]|uniref:Uncharacterized protein n=1 Tax=Calycina marina TaxID=1763456 RepID=A0A9P7YVI5_9HELO|nr:hypothetical protein BJ878DRAFT_528847 [Calycina marina]